jgi:flagellar protein FliS
MFPRNNPSQSYRKVAVQTASPAHLVLMLYDGIIKFLEKSLTGFELRDPLQFNQTVNNNIVRAQAIINELNARLDMDQGEVSENFRRLYNYFNRRLQQGNLKKDNTPVVEVLGHVRGIRDSWAEMMRQGKATEAPSAGVSLQPA